MAQANSTELRKRIASIYSSQKRRAAIHNASLDYTPQDLHQLLVDTTHCRWCGDELNLKTCQCDHIKPVSRFGAYTLANLSWVCGRCNRRKGPLDDVEFTLLTDALNEISAKTGDTFCKCNVLKRLAAARF